MFSKLMPYDSYERHTKGDLRLDQRSVATQNKIDQAVLKLDVWLDSMRTPSGYGGPVAHWWRNCLEYTGAGLDWRYEGLIIGYLNLYKKTGIEAWLAKARRAGDDLVRGQLANGNFRHSCFELNPNPGGTPHEGACDLALLRLAEVLQTEGKQGWQQYAAVAERNLRLYHLEQLWDGQLCGFGNSASYPAFTPNKSATISEALFALAALRGDQTLIEQYVLPTVQTLLSHQIVASDEPLSGAIDQNSVAGKKMSRYFPFYIARCIPVLLMCYEYTQLESYLNAAQRAMRFILRHRLPDGSFPQVIYRNGRMNRYPQWIAGVGDILRAMQLMAESGMQLSEGQTLTWMLNGQENSGGIRTGHGFASQAGQQPPPPLAEFKDILPVCGWVDKAFRYLTSQVQTGLVPSADRIKESELACLFRGRQARYYEDAEVIEVWQQQEPVYRWRKGSTWALTALVGGGIK